MYDIRYSWDLIYLNIIFSQLSPIYPTKIWNTISGQLQVLVSYQKYEEQICYHFLDCNNCEIGIVAIDVMTTDIQVAASILIAIDRPFLSCIKIYICFFIMKIVTWGQQLRVGFFQLIFRLVFAFPNVKIVM